MDEFITDGYFWQGRAVRLRPFRPDDWAMKYQEFLDTEARRFLEYEAELPHTPEDYRERFAGENPVKDERNRLSLAVTWRNNSMCRRLVQAFFATTKIAKYAKRAD